MKKTLSVILAVLFVISSISFISVSAEKPKAEYLEGDTATLNKYIAEAEALTKQIMNSPTEVTWTGTAYYISPYGSDGNDGKSPETAWRSVEKVLDPDFLEPGDAVLFERGGSYRYKGELYAKTGVTYSAYGSGAKPRLIGSIDASSESDWKKTAYENVYEYTAKLDADTDDVGTIVFDNGVAWGVKIMSNVNVDVVSNGLETYDAGRRTVSNAGDLKNDLEFWHDHNSSTLYVYSKNGTPADRFVSVELVDWDNGIRCYTNTDITIDNLSFFGFGVHGVASSTTKNLTVQNCAFSFIGGSTSSKNSTTRLGNAVEVFGSCENFIIRNCYAENIYDCCWTAQFQGDTLGKDMYFKNIEFYNNVCYYSNTGLEVWLANHNPGNGAVFSISNMSLHDNYTLYNGYGWSHQRPNKDANNFCGTSKGLVYENCSVDNNVGIFCAVNVYLAGYVGSDAFNFNNNVYFHDPDLYMGGVAENPELGGSQKSATHKYDAATMAKLIDTGFESGTKFYYMDGYDVPLYDPENMPFEDVKEDFWAYDNIKTSVIRGYFNGISELEFAPNHSMTRAMLVTVLSRIADFDVENKNAPYTDLNDSAWYAKAVKWAYNAGLTDSALTKFRPDEAATREEMADMLYRFALGQKKTAEITEPDLTFSDAASVSPEYAAGIAFATQNGIISGYEDGSVKPKNTATRAEVATMLTRFADIYKTLEADYSSSMTDSQVFYADKLSAMAQAFNGEKRVSEVDGLKILQMLPPDSTYPAPVIQIFERLSGISFADYPYVKVRAKTNSGGTNYSIKLGKGETSGELKFESVKGKWFDEIFCVYDLIPADNADYTTANATLTLSPWEELSHDTYPKRGEDTYDIEYVGFFPSKQAAEAFESEFEKNSAEVTFTVDGKEYAVITVTKGGTIKYPETNPVKNGYAFEGWSIAEGTVINESVTAEAVFERRSGEPIAVFDTETTTPLCATMFDKSILEEDGIKYHHFEVNADTTSVDNSYIRLNFHPADYDISQNKIMKIKYRTNIASSEGFDFNIYLTSTSRLWGPKPEYSIKGEWATMIFDLETVGFTGGENVDESGGKEKVFMDNAKGNVIGIMPKPYHTIGLEMKKGEYLDIAYVALFDSIADAEQHDADTHSRVILASVTEEEEKAEVSIEPVEQKVIVTEGGLVFDTNGMSAKSGTMFDISTAQDDSGEYYHFEVNADGTSVDGTFAHLILAQTEYDITQNSVVKIKYRTNVKSSERINFDVYLTNISRLWGPKIKISEKGEWCTAILDLKTADFNGGENIDMSGGNEMLFSDNAKGNIYSILLKPYDIPGNEMKKGEYFDIAYIGLFDTAANAELYN